MYLTKIYTAVYAAYSYCMTMTTYVATPHRLEELLHPNQYVDLSQHHVTYVPYYACAITNPSSYKQKPFITVLLLYGFHTNSFVDSF